VNLIGIPTNLQLKKKEDGKSPFPIVPDKEERKKEVRKEQDTVVFVTGKSSAWHEIGDRGEILSMRASPTPALGR